MKEASASFLGTVTEAVDGDFFRVAVGALVVTILMVRVSEVLVETRKRASPTCRPSWHEAGHDTAYPDGKIR
jgi:hypothetical protein